MDRAKEWWERTFHHRSVLSSDGTNSSENNSTEVVGEKYKEYWTICKRRTPYYVPVLSWLPRYRWRECLPRDVVAGLAVASILIPQSLAYALLAGLPPKMGLYSAWIPLLVYFVFGTSKHLSIGPDAMASIMVGTTMGTTVDSPQAVASMFALLGGLFLLVLGLFRLGFLDNMLARPLLVGLINAVALIIVFEQVDTFFGVQASLQDHSWEKIGYTFQHRSEISWATFGVGVFSLVVLFTLKYVRYRYSHKISVRLMSPILVVVLLSIFFTAACKLDLKWKLRVLGAISQKYDPPAAPRGWSVQSLQRHLPPAMLIAMVGFVEAIVAAKRYADKNDYVIYPNRELIAIGLLNFVGSFFHSYPTFGSLARTSITDAMGATSQMFAFVAFIIVTLTISFAGPIFYYLPRVTMASVIIYAAASMADHHDAMFYIRLKAWKEVVLMLAVFLFTVVLGIELGILLMIIMSIFILVRYTSNPHIAVLGRSPQSGKYKDRKQFPDVIIDPSVIIVRIEESLFFANTDRIREIFARIELTGSLTSHPADTLAATVRLEGIVIHARNIPDMDASAIQAVGEMIRAYAKRDVVVCFVKLRESLRHQMVQAEILESMDSEFVFSSIDEAVRYLQERRRVRMSSSQSRVNAPIGPGDEEDLPNLEGVSLQRDITDRNSAAESGGSFLKKIKTFAAGGSPANSTQPSQNLLEEERGRTMQEFLQRRRAPPKGDSHQRQKFEALPSTEAYVRPPPPADSVLAQQSDIRQHESLSLQNVYEHSSPNAAQPPSSTAVLSSTPTPAPASVTIDVSTPMPTIPPPPSVQSYTYPSSSASSLAATGSISANTSAGNQTAFGSTIPPSRNPFDTADEAKEEERIHPNATMTTISLSDSSAPIPAASEDFNAVAQTTQAQTIAAATATAAASSSNSDESAIEEIDL